MPRTANKPETKTTHKKAPLKAEIIATAEADHKKLVAALAEIHRKTHKLSIRRIVKDALGEEFASVIK